jgi:hypothetical protein
VPAVERAFGVVTKSFAHPQRRRKTRGPQLREDLRGLFIGVLLDHATVGGNDDKLVASVVGHFKEPGVKHRSFNDCVQFTASAEPFPAGSACANDIGPAGIVWIVWIRLIDRINSNETRIVPALDSNLLAHSATDVG